MTPATRVATPFDTCSLCPRLCRSACPVSTSGRELATPTWIATVLRDWRRGAASAEDAARVATLCTDCGACRELCHLHRPLPELLREVRAELDGRLPAPVPAPAPLDPIEGEGRAVAVETDERPLAAWLARRLGAPIRRWRTRDRLGAAAIETSGWSAHAAQIRQAAGALEVLVADGGAAAALRSAGVAFAWAWDRAGDAVAVGSCATGGERPLACCGGAGPLPVHHPDDARRLGALFAARAGAPAEVADARCAAHLCASGAPTGDWIDRLGRAVRGEEP